MHTGYTIIRPLETLNWRALPLGDDLTFETLSACPACKEHTLRELVSLVFSETSSMNVALCATCGWIGYGKRPTRAWTSEFYANLWHANTANKDLAALRTKKQPENHAAAIVRKAVALGADLTRPALEIGAGHGTMLRFLQAQGFSSVLGVESSPRRAGIARHLTGAEVCTGDFESEEVQTRLRRAGPFSFISSFHVLEHTFFPAEIIHTIGLLQQDGDFLALGVPHGDHEAPMNIALFLPHLHSFSPMALLRLFIRGGYEVVETLVDESDITFLARKTAAPKAHLTESMLSFDDTRTRFRNAFHLDEIVKGTSRYYWSKYRSDETALLPDSWFLALKDRIRPKEGLRSLLLDPLSLRKSDGALIVFEFGDQPFLFIK